MINSYPSIYTVGHKGIENLFDGPVIIEEKIDGSQFSMGVIDGELICRSKGAQINIDEPEKMFKKAVETAKTIWKARLFLDNVIYRCEYLQKPKHNTLAYARIPKHNLILFDVMISEEKYLSPQGKFIEAERFGMEAVPLLYEGEIIHMDQLLSFLPVDSVLGGTKIEGIVIKNYEQFTRSKKIAIGKLVSEDFKEKHSGEWRKSNPTQTNILEHLIETYRHENRWKKAVQHLRDSGDLENSPRDIGKLIREIPADILKEHEEEIKETLFKHFWPKIKRGVTRGMPEWYKQELLKGQFDE